MHRRNFTIVGCGHEPANGVYVFEGFRNMFPFFVKRELQFDDEPINFGNDKLDIDEFPRLDTRVDVCSGYGKHDGVTTAIPKNARIVDDESGIIFALYGGVISAHGDLMWVIARVDCNPPIYYYAAFHESLYPEISVYSCAVPTDTWTVLNGAEPAPRLKLTIYATELLDKGSEVEVFSTSQQKWKRAVISQVDGDEFHIECEADGWRSRVRRGSGRLRPTVEQRKERAKWKENTPVEVFSVSNSKWKPAKIIEIKELRVEYADGSGGKWMGADSDWIKAINQPEHESDLLNYEGELATHMQAVVRNVYSTYACGRGITRREFCQFLQAAWPNKRKRWYVQMTNDEFDHYQAVMSARQLQEEHEQGLLGPRRGDRRRRRHHVPRQPPNYIGLPPRVQIISPDGHGRQLRRTRRRERGHRNRHHHHHHHHGHRHRHGRNLTGGDAVIAHAAMRIPNGIGPHHRHLLQEHGRRVRDGRAVLAVPHLGIPPMPLYSDEGVVRFNPNFDFNGLNFVYGDSNGGERRIMSLADIHLNDIEPEFMDMVVDDLDESDDERELMELEKHDVHDYGFAAFAEYFLNSCSDRPKATRTLLVNLAHREFEKPALPPQPWKVIMKVNAYSKTQKEWKRATIVQMNKQGGKLHVQYGDESGRKWLARYSDHIRPRIETRARIALWATNRFLEVLEGLQTSALGSLLNAELARFLVEYNFDECNQCHYFDDIYAVCFGNGCSCFMCRTCWNDGFNFHNCEAMTQGHRRASESMSPETPFLFVSTFDECAAIDKKRKIMSRIRMEEAQAKIAMQQFHQQQRHHPPHQSGLYPAPFEIEGDDSDLIDMTDTQDFVNQVVSQQEIGWLNQRDSDLDAMRRSVPRDMHNDIGPGDTSPSPSFVEESLSFSIGRRRSEESPPPPLHAMDVDVMSDHRVEYHALPRRRIPLDAILSPSRSAAPSVVSSGRVMGAMTPPRPFEFGRDRFSSRRYFGGSYAMAVDDEKLDDLLGPGFPREISQEHDRPTRRQPLFGEETLLQRVELANATGASQSSHSSTPDPNEDGSSPVLDDDGDFEVRDSVGAAPREDERFSPFGRELSGSISPFAR